MHNFTTKSFLLTLLCLFISTVVKAQGYVHPTITDDNEVCIFLLSSDDTQFYFSGNGGDYSGASTTTNALVKQGQLEDGLYLYKWERPADATGTPVTFSLYKGGTADENIIYRDKSYVNHGVFIEAKNSTTTTIDNVAHDHEVTANETNKTDADKAYLESDDEHSVFFETDRGPNATIHIWPYDDSKNYEGDHFTTASKFPGDTLAYVDKLDNGNYLYKWTQTKNTGDIPASVIFSPKHDSSDQYASTEYKNHGYYINTYKTVTGQTEVYQFGKAYVTTDNTQTSNLDPLAHLDVNDEVSLFLESPDSTHYYLWPYRLDQVDGKDSVTYKGEYFTNTTWPGEKMNYVGKLSNGHYLFKWIMNTHITIEPNKFSICDNKDDKAKAITGATDASFTNHGYYILKKDEGASSISYQETVTRRSDGSYSTNRTSYGKRVIYEMNIGSFTPSGKITAAKERLSYLKNLGVDVIWLMPVYPRRTPDEGNTGSSPYAVKDFKAVNESYGSLADLKNFVTTAHTLGMDVWLDFVANHTSTDNAWVTSHPEYYTKVDGKMVHPASDGKYYSEGETAPTDVTVYTDVYQLDYNTILTDTTKRRYNPATDAMEDAMKYWVDQTDIDGFRFDMVSSQSITNTFWRAVTNDLKAIKSSMQFLAEADFTRDKNVSPSNFTYDYAWGFNDNLRSFGQSYTTYQANGTTDLTHITKSFLDDINGVSINPMVYLTNHDANWGTANDGKYTMKDIWGDNRYAMTVYEFTMPGMPLIYNGQEQDGTVKLDYFNDTKISWNTTMDYKMFGLITELSQLKHTNNALNDGENSGQRGDTRILNSYSNDGVFAYERIKGDQHVLVVLNLSNAAKSSTILGATQGTWKRILSGNNQGIDNTNKDENIGEIWQATDIPAHGFQIFTYTGDKHNYATGIYFVCDDNEGNPRAHQMEHSSEDDNYNYYRFVINASDFNALSTKEGSSTPEDRLSFRFQEYYDFFGTVCRNDAMFGAGSATNDEFSVNSATKEYNFVKNTGENTNPFYLKKAEDADKIEKYIITFARSKSNTDEGKVSLQFVKEGSVLPGYYLLTPANVQSQNVDSVHQWRFKSKSEDEAAVSDRYLANLNEDKIDLVSYTITANEFDSYVPADRKAGNAIQFRILQTGYDNGELKDNASSIDPAPADAQTDSSTFDASRNDAKIYNAHWDTYSSNPAFFKIVYQPDVSKYIIQTWRTSTSNDGQTRVRVYYVRQYNYQGSTIEDVTASNEDCYLYNVDAQKFLYVGNDWGTMASLLYDDLGTRLNISGGKTDENPNYKLIRTRMENNTTVPDGHMLGIDDWSYDANSQWPENRLDSGFIYTDRDNGNRWIFEKADNISYANTYTLKLYDTRDGRYHLLVADHMDGNSDEAKKANTRVKYKAVRDTPTSYTMNAKNIENWYFYSGNAHVSDNKEYITGLGGYTQDGDYRRYNVIMDYNQLFNRDYDIPYEDQDSVELDVEIKYISSKDLKLSVEIDTTDYDAGEDITRQQFTLDAPSTGSDTDVSTAKTLHCHFARMPRPWDTDLTILIAKQDDEAPNIVEYTVTNTNIKKSAEYLKYARWQIVTYSDLVNKLKSENAELYGGTSADATFLMKDQGFTRYIQNTWDTEVSDTSNVKVTKNAIGDFSDVGMYWNGHITGKGKVYQDVDVPIYGVYQFNAYGFYNGSPTLMFYQYATGFDANGNATGWTAISGNTPLYYDKEQTYKDRTTDIATGELFYKESVLGGAPEHLNTQFLYVPQNAATYNGNYRIRIGFNKTADDEGDYTAVDDVHLHYIGKTPFIIDDSWDSTLLDSAITAEKNANIDNDRKNVPVWIKREFWSNCWNAIVFPVSVSTTQLRSIFGDDVEVAAPYGLDDTDANIIRFNPVNLSSGSVAIEAGKFYIVRPTKLVGTSTVMTLRDNGDNYEPQTQTIVPDGKYDFKYYNLGNHDISEIQTKVDSMDVNTVDFRASAPGHPNSIKIKGSYTKMTAPISSYVFASDGNMWHLDTTVVLNGCRFYIEDVYGVMSGAKGVDFGSLSDDLDGVLNGLTNKGDKGETTDIDGVTTFTDNGRRAYDGSVYDLSGRRVAINGDTSNLPSGVYIINGKKYIKK